MHLKLQTPLALFFAVFSVAASAAQAPTLYGVLDIGLVGGFNKAIPPAAADIRHDWGNGNLSGVRQNYTSRFGAFAIEDLGGGVSVEARAEGTLDPNHTFYFDRQAYVAVHGPYGSLRAGRTRDLINGIASRVDPFNNDGLVQDKILLAQQAGIGLFRIPNAFTYVTPTRHGFAGSVQFAFNNTVTGNDAIKLLLTYDDGPFGLHVGLDKPSRNARSDGSFTFGPNAYNLIVGARHDVGRIKLAAELLYANRDMQAADVAASLPKSDGNRLGWITSARLPVRSGEFKMVLVKSDMVFNKFGVQQPIREIGFGYEHFLSKRSFLFIQLGLEKNSNGGHWHAGMNTKF